MSILNSICVCIDVHMKRTSLEMIPRLSNIFVASYNIDSDLLQVARYLHIL